MGLHRQGVQRFVNEMAKEGIAQFQRIPHHKRAHHVLLTAKGRNILDAAIALQIPWVNALSKGLKPKDIATAKSVIDRIKTRLEQ